MQGVSGEIGNEYWGKTNKGLDFYVYDGWVCSAPPSWEFCLQCWIDLTSEVLVLLMAAKFGLLMVFRDHLEAINGECFKGRRNEYGFRLLERV